MMNNKVMMILFVFLGGQFLNAQEVHKQNVETEINHATIFLSGAEIKRKHEVKIKKGINQLRFINISTSADSRSIQFEAKEKIDLLSISMERDFLRLSERSDKIKNIKDSITLFESDRQDIIDERGALDSEKQLLVQNQKIGGENVNLTVQEIKAAADFYRTRMTEINKKMSEYTRENKKIDKKIQKLQQQLAEYNYRENVKDNVIVVLLEADQPGTIQTELRYNVSNCGWAPSYDLTAEDISGKIDLKYKAKVYNNTGNDWNDIKVKLSTGDPNLSATLPQLDPWFLNNASLNQIQIQGKRQYAVPQAKSKVNAYQQNVDHRFGEGRIQNTHTGNIDGTTTPEVRMETIEVSELTTEFEVERPYTIPSDSRPYIVEITEYELNGDFSHVSVPKLDKDAFLLAKITGWEKLDLVPGPSNVYFAQTYVGESYINTRNVEDTLGLSFGRDKKILVTRKKVEEYSDKKVIGSWKKDMYSYEIIVKNNRSRDITLELKDQVPVSQDSDISISVEETSGAKYDEADGSLVWNVNLKPGESIKYVLTFEVKYPKTKTFSVKRYRSVSAPSF